MFFSYFLFTGHFRCFRSFRVLTRYQWWSGSVFRGKRSRLAHHYRFYGHLFGHLSPPYVFRRIVFAKRLHLPPGQVLCRISVRGPHTIYNVGGTKGNQTGGGFHLKKQEYFSIFNKTSSALCFGIVTWICSL